MSKAILLVEDNPDDALLMMKLWKRIESGIKWWSLATVSKHSILFVEGSMQSGMPDLPVLYYLI